MQKKTNWNTDFRSFAKKVFSFVWKKVVKTGFHLFSKKSWDQVSISHLQNKLWKWAFVSLQQKIVKTGFHFFCKKSPESGIFIFKKFFQKSIFHFYEYFRIYFFQKLIFDLTKSVMNVLLMIFFYFRVTAQKVNPDFRFNKNQRSFG